MQLRDEDFVATIAQILKAAGEEVGIDIEVTESVLMQDVAENIQKLSAVARPWRPDSARRLRNRLLIIVLSRTAAR